jgi:Recombinase zinc beta ribbon domain
LLQCQHCGYAFYGKRLSPSARKGKPRAYAYYRCLGTDAYRFGGERLCQNTQVRTDLVDLAVWQEVCTLLAHPERLAEEYRRRLQPEMSAKRPPLATVESQISQLRQGVARLIDSYAEGLIDKYEFEPRITRLRQRLARLEEQRQHLADEAASQAELQLIIGRLEDFATKVHHSLEDADWASQRDLIRTLVKRVEVAQDQVNIVFRVDPYLGDPDPEKKSLQLCRGSGATPLGRPFLLLSPVPILQHARLEPLADVADDALVPNPVLDKLHQPCVVNRIVKATNVGIEYPVDVALFNPDRDRIQRVVRAASWAGTVREPEKLLLVDSVEHLDCRPLDDFVFQRRLADGSLATISFRNVDAFDRWGLLCAPLQSV